MENKDALIVPAFEKSNVLYEAELFRNNSIPSKIRGESRNFSNIKIRNFGPKKMRKKLDGDRSTFFLTIDRSEHHVWQGSFEMTKNRISASRNRTQTPRKLIHQCNTRWTRTLKVVVSRARQAAHKTSFKYVHTRRVFFLNNSSPYSRVENHEHCYFNSSSRHDSHFHIQMFGERDACSNIYYLYKVCFEASDLLRLDHSGLGKYFLCTRYSTSIEKIRFRVTIMLASGSVERVVLKF